MLGPLSTAPPAGAVIAIAGAVRSTVTGTICDVWFPAASVATTVIWAAPSAVSGASYENAPFGAATSAPPTCTVSGELSDAVPSTRTVSRLVTTPAAGAEIDSAGATESTTTSALAVPALFATSSARTLIVSGP